MDLTALRTEYERRLSVTLQPLAERLQKHLRDLLIGVPRIDSILARAKSADRFLQKAKKESGGQPKYTDPLNQIQDQLAARVVVFYLDDVEPACEKLKSYFMAIEEKAIVPDSPNEFGYEGTHFIFFVPTELLDGTWSRADYPTLFELQVQTLFQHAWAEANHDLAYKGTGDLGPEQKRRVAFTAAQAWGADWIFKELAAELGMLGDK